MGTGKNSKTSFNLHSSLCPVSTLYQRAILDFEQFEESIGAAWARFSALIHAGPDLSLLDNILPQLFCLGIDMGANLCPDMIAGGCFTHKTMTEQVEFLEHFIEKHSSFVIRTKSLQAKVMSSVEESSPVKSKTIPSLDSTHEPSPKPQTLKERVVHPSEFSIEFKDYGNTSKLSW